MKPLWYLLSGIVVALATIIDVSAFNPDTDTRGYVLNFGAGITTALLANAGVALVRGGQVEAVQRVQEVNAKVDTVIKQTNGALSSGIQKAVEASVAKHLPTAVAEHLATALGATPPPTK